MKIRHCIAPLVCLCFSAAWTWAADLTQVERKIGREPAYASKPQYCLTAFGPNAEARVWLVLDGDTLYVDRNANGDLTDDGEPVAAKKDAEASVSAGNLQFPAGDLCLGKLTHKNFWVLVRRLDGLAQDRAGPDDRHVADETVKAVRPHARGKRSLRLQA